jgi:hypothetical protein
MGVGRGLYHPMQVYQYFKHWIIIDVPKNSFLITVCHFKLKKQFNNIINNHSQIVHYAVAQASDRKATS